MNKKYITSYKINKKEYGSYVYAKSFKEADKLAEQRNIGEVVLGIGGVVKDGYGRNVPKELSEPDFRDLTDYEFIHNLPQIIHYATFLGFVNEASNRITTKELLGDEGVIHELVHLLTGANFTPSKIKKVRNKFYELQELTIGLNNK